MLRIRPHALRGEEVDRVRAVGSELVEAPHIRNAVEREAHADQELRRRHVDVRDALRAGMLHLQAVFAAPIRCTAEHLLAPCSSRHPVTLVHDLDT